MTVFGSPTLIVATVVRHNCRPELLVVAHDDAWDLPSAEVSNGEVFASAAIRAAQQCGVEVRHPLFVGLEPLQLIRPRHSHDVVLLMKAVCTSDEPRTPLQTYEQIHKPQWVGNADLYTQKHGSVLGLLLGTGFDPFAA